MIAKAMLLGVIEGLTEFIPISSTGHLILAGHLLAFPEPFAATFDVAIQAGAISAALVLYWPFFSHFSKPRHWISKDAKLIFISCLPAAIVGVVAHSTIKKLLFTPLWVAIAFVVGGIALLIIEKKCIQTKETPVAEMTYRQALAVGVAQCASLWPGMSRSGSAIAGGLLSKMGYQSSARYSFLIAVPLIIAASIFDLGKSGFLLTNAEWIAIGVGIITSFIVALASIKLFLTILNRFRLVPFAYYRIGIGSLIILVELLK